MLFSKLFVRSSKALGAYSKSNTMPARGQNWVRMRVRVRVINAVKWRVRVHEKVDISMIALCSAVQCQANDTSIGCLASDSLQYYRSPTAAAARCVGGRDAEHRRVRVRVT